MVPLLNPFRRAIRAHGVVACLFGALSSAAVAAAEDEALEVDMPDYVISADRELPPPESWRYVLVPAGELTRGESVVVAPGYEILSNLSEKNTRLFARELQRRQLVGALLWPMIVQAQPRPPMAVVVDMGRQWHGTLNTADPAAGSIVDLPDDIAWQGDPISTIEFTNEPMDVEPRAIGDALTGRPINGMQTRVMIGGAPTTLEPSVFDSTKIQPLPRGFVGLWTSDGLLVAEVRAGEPLAGSERPDEERLAASLNQEASLATLQALSSRSKPWLRVGLGWLIASTTVTSTEIEFAGVPAKLRQRSMPSLVDTLTSAEPLGYEHETLASAFVHYGLYGDNGKRARGFVQLVARLEQEGPSDSLFLDTLGEDLARTEKRLAGYVHAVANYRSIKLRGNLPEPPPITVREASQAEIARLKARLACAQGRPDLGLAMLRVGYLRGEREPAMLTLLATLESTHGSWERAAKLVAAVRTQGEPPASIHLIEARVAFRKATDGLEADARLDRAATAAIMQPLARALRAGQGSEALWEFMATVVRRSAARPHESIVRYLEQAAQRYPENATIRDAAVSALARQPEPKP